MSVYAVMYTNSLFDYKTCNKAQAWRPLGYIPIEKLPFFCTMETDEQGSKI